MSYIISSIHPPSIISSVTTAKLEYDALVLSRGNEILISEITDNFVSKPKIYQLFGNISGLACFDSNKLAVLLEKEKLLIFEIILGKLSCFYRTAFEYRIGRKSPACLISASNSLIVCHTRIRMIQVIQLQQAVSFTQNLSFSEIHTIKCFDGSCEFVVSGKNLSGQQQVTLFEVKEKVVLKKKSISFPEIDQKPAILIKSPDEFIITVNKDIEACKNYSQRTRLYSHKSEITSLFELDGNTLASCDVKNQTVNIANGTTILSLKDVSEVTPIGHEFFFETSKEGDAHLLKYNNSILKVVDTFAQMNCSCFMNRSQLITKSGIIRSFVNGSPTAEEIIININCGKRIWSINDYFVISTFDATIVLDNKTFAESDLNFKKDSETIEIIQTPVENKVIQITPDRIRIVDLSSSSDNEDIKFNDGELAMYSAYFHNTFVIALSNNSVNVYTLSVVENSEVKIELVNNLPVQFSPSAVALNEEFVSVSFWEVPLIQAFDITSMKKVKEVKFADNDKNFVCSLVFDEESNSLIGGTSDGDIIITSQKATEPPTEPKTLHVSSSPIRLKRINGQILMVSDVSAFLHPISVFQESDVMSHEFNVDYISISASFDAAEFKDKIAFVSSKGVIFISVESNHHSHIEDKSISFNSISLISVDETNHCPTVYSVKSNSKSSTPSYKLFATGRKPFKLGLEIPSSMIWFYHKCEYFLVVGCEIEKSGCLLLFNSKLEKLSTANLTSPVDALCSVLDTYIAVASGKSLHGFAIEDNNLVCKCSEPTRIKCASLTSPNSFAVVYADRKASASIYKMCDNEIALIATDMNPKSLKFARLESETDVLAIGDNSVIYSLELVEGNQLKTNGAFGLDCQVSAVFSSPNLSLVTKSGSLILISKNDEIFVRIFNAMKNRIKGIGGLLIDEMRLVENNGCQYGYGKFVDGDFVGLFEMLPEAEQMQIARTVGEDVNKIRLIIRKYLDSLIEYREKSQTNPSF